MFNKTNVYTKSLMAASLGAMVIAAAPTASAQEDDGLFQLSANVAVASDYRFRGVSLSGRAFAIQGGFDVTTESGFYVGTWGSSIDPYNGSELELDIYAGYTGELSGYTYDVGLLEYTYPGSVGLSPYLEAYASVGASYPVGKFEASIAYYDTNIEDFDMKTITSGGVVFSLGASF